MKYGVSCMATEATIGHLEITIIAKKEETATGQVKKQSNALTVFQLIWNSSQKERL
jgi:hypothetical protein